MRISVYLISRGSIKVRQEQNDILIIIIYCASEKLFHRAICSSPSPYSPFKIVLDSTRSVFSPLKKCGRRTLSFLLQIVTQGHIQNFINQHSHTTDFEGTTVLTLSYMGKLFGRRILITFHK